MKEQLQKLHKEARLARDAAKIEAYGAALAAIQEGEVRENKDFDEAKVLAVVEKEAGKFRESAESFAKAGREDQATEIKLRSDFLVALLPAKLDASAYPDLVAKAVQELQPTGMKDMGKVMAKLKGELGPSIDMKVASQEVKNALMQL
ncbi:GatB/YqeY domain-containing protein [Puniceicoccaceae bacterium K14]|nr:GatB/YqeY domain-containing protein [Puniceicoccaceae bacterium K14]